MIRFLADGLMIIIVLVSGGAGLWWLIQTRPNIRKIIPYVLMAGLTSLVVGKIMSLWQTSDVRPFVEQGVGAGAATLGNAGFPSDHALLATVVVLAVYMLTPYKKLSYVLAGGIVVMSIARVLALVHTPLDIVGGIVAGLVGVVWYIKLRTDNHKHILFNN